MSIRQAVLNPPKPPKRREPRVVLLATSGFLVRVDVDGSASLVDGVQEITLAEFTAEESVSIAQTLADMIGGPR